ncbi:MAG: signal peptidase I [Candidatus Parcubacteria bacterium]|nr:signal peptidase I [Candidatus Parcubacteria bacterium]
MKKTLKIIYYIGLGFIVFVTILLVVSAIPVPGNIKLMVVQSGSMEPTIKTGSVVMVKPVKDYKVGDIITFGPYSKTKAPTTHRIFEIKTLDGQSVYVTKGDANNAQDLREISKGDILGKVLFFVPYLGYAVEFAKQPLGFILVIAIPAIIIVGDEIKNIWQEVSKLKNKKKDSDQDKEITKLKEEINKLKEDKD